MGSNRGNELKFEARTSVDVQSGRGDWLCSGFYISYGGSGDTIQKPKEDLPQRSLRVSAEPAWALASLGWHRPGVDPLILQRRRNRRANDTRLEAQPRLQDFFFITVDRAMRGSSDGRSH